VRHCLKTLAVFIALLFVFSTNRCTIAAAFPNEAEQCCLSERTPGDSERGQPCSGKDCLPCVTLESGFPLVSLIPLTIAAPVWTDAEAFADFMRRLMVAVVEDIPAAPPDPTTIPLPPWCDVLTKSLPVRGPSLVA
jgi:hypothetical protein